MNLLRIFCMCCFISTTWALGAQVVDKEIAAMLSENDRAKIEKADSYINQGNEILFVNNSYSKEKLFQRKPNYIQLSENMLVGKRVSRLLFQTKSYYKVGFEGAMEVLNSHINNYLKNEAQVAYKTVLILNDSIKSHLESAKANREKSKLTANLKKAGKQIHQSNIEYQKAIHLSEKAIQIIESDKTIHSGIVVQDELDKQDTAIIEQPKVVQEEPKTDLALVNKNPVPEIKEELKPEAPKPVTLLNEPLMQGQAPANKSTTEAAKAEVYYTVQFLADKKPVSNISLKKVYSGPFPIVVNRGDGWYRYSFGKFNSLVDAKIALADSKTKAYVVAYKNKTRISLREAKLLMDESGK